MPKEFNEFITEKKTSGLFDYFKGKIEDLNKTKDASGITFEDWAKEQLGAEGSGSKYLGFMVTKGKVPRPHDFILVGDKFSLFFSIRDDLEMELAKGDSTFDNIDFGEIFTMLDKMIPGAYPNV